MRFMKINRREFMCYMAAVSLSVRYEANPPQPTIIPFSESVIEQKLNREIERYGKVTYSYNTTSKNQIYVVGQAHENPDGTMEHYVPKVQLEIFRIGQILAENHDVMLGIQEGEGCDEQQDDYKAMFEGLGEKVQYLKALSDEDIMANFGSVSFCMPLLVAANGIDVQGAEDGRMHSIAKHIAKLNGFNSKSWEYVNDVRSAKVLMQTPSVASREYLDGRTPNLDALVVIGNAHLPAMMRFVKYKIVYIPAIEGTVFGEVVEPFDLASLDYGITFIEPNGLLKLEKKAA